MQLCVYLCESSCTYTFEWQREREGGRKIDFLVMTVMRSYETVPNAQITSKRCFFRLIFINECADSFFSIVRIYISNETQTTHSLRHKTHLSLSERFADAALLSHNLKETSSLIFALSVSTWQLNFIKWATELNPKHTVYVRVD